MARKGGLPTKVEHGTRLVFNVSSEIVEEAKTEYEFSFDMLKIGGEMSLPELAEHLDQQAGLEARYGTLAELARYRWQVVQQKFDLWYQRKFASAVKNMTFGNNKPTEKQVKSHIILKYGKKYKELQDEVMLAEHTYKMLSDAIHASIVTKGKMLQSIRNVLMGNSSIGINTEKQATIIT